MRMTIEVTNCMDCQMRRSHSGHGECWDYCSHKESPGGYDNILFGCFGEFKGTPDWCPIKDEVV